MRSVALCFYFFKLSLFLQFSNKLHRFFASLAQPAYWGGLLVQKPTKLKEQRNKPLIIHSQNKCAFILMIIVWVINIWYAIAIAVACNAYMYTYAFGCATCLRMKWFSSFVCYKYVLCWSRPVSHNSAGSSGILYYIGPVWATVFFVVSPHLCFAVVLA